MKRRVLKWFAWITVLFVVLHMPIMTEYRIQRLIWHLKSNPSIDAIISAYGKPAKTLYPFDEKIPLSGEDLNLSEGEELWLYQEEGMPYWIFGVVTDDGKTVKRYVVDRLW